MPIGYFSTLPYKLQTVFVLIPMLGVAHISHSQYAYRFLIPTFKKERHIALVVSIIIFISELAFVAWNEFIYEGGIDMTLKSAFFYSSLYTFWIILLSFRKARFLHLSHPSATRAHYIYAAINGCYVAAAVFSIIFGFFSLPGFWSYFSFVWFGNLAAIVLYIVTAAVPANFQTKITGFGFVLAASFLTIITLTFNPPILLENTAGRLAQQESLSRLMIITTVVVLMIVLLMPFMLKVSITKPLLRLLDGVKQVNAGNLDTVVAVGLQDEVGLLTAHFNQMTLNLKKARQELTDYAQTLEKKVLRRTAQLQTSLTELKALQAQLIQAEKIASLGELTAGIAHEIKNPLNFINNFSTISVELCNELEEELEGSPSDLENIKAIVEDISLNLERINHHGMRANAIVDGMLEHSRTSKGESQVTDINSLTEENLHECYNHLLGKKKITAVKLQTFLDGTLSENGSGKLNVVKQDVGRALSNIFSNAFYSVTDKKNKADERYEPVVTVSTKHLPGKIEIKIRDNGVGIKRAIIDKIFQPFFTTKPTGEGTGLGLSLSYDIIKAHGGELRVETREGEFAEFTVELPL
jgi:signal transduction histidine kinase